jgi:hypothetical protein
MERKSKIYLENNQQNLHFTPKALTSKPGASSQKSWPVIIQYQTTPMRQVDDPNPC